MTIEKKLVRHNKRRLIQSAHYEYEDTGRTEIQTIEENGQRVEKPIPIHLKKLVEATYEDIIEEHEVFTIDDGVDVHEFISKEDAMRFKNANSNPS